MFKPLIQLSRISGGIAQFLDLLYPRFCTLCFRPLQSNTLNRFDCDLCESCVTGLTCSAGFCCERCGFVRPLERLGCHMCVLRNYAFDRTWVLGEYAGHLKRAVLAIKSSSGRPLAHALGALIAEKVTWSKQQGAVAGFDIVLPVPTHWKRRLARRGSCVDIIAKRIASSLQTPFHDRMLTVTRVACKQGTLDAASRMVNVRDLFAIRKKHSVNRLKGKRVLLVDDVMTSGATLHELAELLMRSEVRQVCCAVIARGAA